MLGENIDFWGGAKAQWALCIQKWALLHTMVSGSFVWSINGILRKGKDFPVFTASLYGQHWATIWLGTRQLDASPENASPSLRFQFSQHSKCWHTKLPAPPQPFAWPSAELRSDCRSDQIRSDKLQSCNLANWIHCFPRGWLSKIHSKGRKGTLPTHELWKELFPGAVTGNAWSIVVKLEKCGSCIFWISKQHQDLRWENRTTVFNSSSKEHPKTWCIHLVL